MKIDNGLHKYWNNPSFWNQYGLDSCYGDRVHMVKRLLPADIATILDVGVGKGEIVNDIYQMDKNVKALDVSIEALKYVQCPSTIGTIQDLPYKANAFDLIMCLEVLEHLPDSVFKAGVSELQRVADKYLLIGVPFRENIEYRRTRCPSCGEVFNADTHFRSFDSVVSLARLFSEFHPLIHVLTGPLYRRPTRFGTWIQQKVLGAYLPWPTYIICLHCGFASEESQPLRLPMIQRLAIKANSLLSRFRETHPEWLLVLLQRKK